MKKAAMSSLVLVLVIFALGRTIAQAPTDPPKDSAHGENRNQDGYATAPVYPLKVSAKGRYLVDQKNVPFLIAGDSPQALMSNLSEAEADRYFANRQAHGFNAAGWINVVSAKRTYPASHKDGSTYDNIRPFTGFIAGGDDYAHYDLTKPNEAYFARLDRIVKLAANHGIVVFLDPMETIDWLPTLRNNGPAAAYGYGQYLGNRYKNFRNIAWLNGNDFNTWKTPADDAVVLAVAKGIKSADPGHLQTVELHVPTSSSLDDPAWAPIISLNSTYTYSPTYIQMLRSYNQKPTTPNYLVEAHYDLEKVGDPTDFGTPSVLRRQEYWTMLSGGTGQFYGNRYTWTFEPGWQSKLDTDGATQFTIWKKFFSSLPWHDLVPDQAHKVVTAGLGTFGDFRTRVSKSDYCTAAKTPDGALVVAYMPTARTLTVNMSSLKSPAKGKWFDPTNGAYHPIAGSPFANSGSRQFTPPEKNHAGDGDWVLVLAASSTEGPGSSKTHGERAPITCNGPLKQSRNPNYFEDDSGAPLILCGSHTWNTLQDWGTDGSIRPLDFDAFVSFLKVHGHNFTLLWQTELPKITNLPTTETSPPVFTVSPHPWMRTGPGVATDGGLKFDLRKFDQAYFKRLRARVQALDSAGIYVGVYLFTGEFLLRFRSPTDGYPFSGPNNINGIADGYRGGAAQTATGAVTMTAANAVTDFQDAYVKKTIDTLNDLPNVLWIVSEEAPSKSTWWNDHLIAVVRAYEKGKRFQHPIGYGALDNAPDSLLYNSDADWVAPSAKISPERSCGTGKLSCKVNINDSDHSYFGMWNDTPHTNRNYAWENFARGSQVLFMDPYLVHYPRQKRNFCLSPVHGIGTASDPRWENFRNNLGYLLRYSRKLNLANVTPKSALCSTKYCLAQTPAAGAEYLAYAPSGGPFTMDLSAMPSSRKLAVEWFNPATGTTIPQNPLAAGSSSQAFTPPFSGDAVLYLVDTAGHK